MLQGLRSVATSRVGGGTCIVIPGGVGSQGGLTCPHVVDSASGEFAKAHKEVRCELGWGK